MEWIDKMPKANSEKDREKMNETEMNTEPEAGRESCFMDKNQQVLYASFLDTPVYNF